MEYLCRRQEEYQETGWSAMSGLETDLQQLEAHLADQFGDHSDSNDGSDEEDDDNTANGGVLNVLPLLVPCCFSSINLCVASLLYKIHIFL